MRMVMRQRASRTRGIASAMPPARWMMTYIRLVPFVSAEHLGTFYHEIVDCVLLPSLQEGCSNVVLEALATDRMMILTDVGNAREAAALSARVRIVPPAYPDVHALTPVMIAELSRTSDTSNVQEVVNAMFDMILDPPSPTDAANLESRMLAIDSSIMARHYGSFIAAEALLAA
jgi:glycosyltransferase involved in cell wall biosynthesis